MRGALQQPGWKRTPVTCRAITWCLLLMLAFPAMLRAQKATPWRVYRASDGLRESLATSITVSPRGKVWVTHGEVDEISCLDGYRVSRLPASVNSR